MRFTYPRYVGKDRGPGFHPSGVDRSVFDWAETKALGSIPQVPHTLAYIDGSYGIVNEAGVSLGESTCGSKLVSAPLYAGGKALFEIAELGRVALERARTAREAIRVIGDLAVAHGYYSCEWEGSFAQLEGGEAYTVTDEREAWVMHVSPDDTGASAVWVARRVPDDHVAVVTNGFTIRELPPQPPAGGEKAAAVTPKLAQQQQGSASATSITSGPGSGESELAVADPDVWMMSRNIYEVAVRAGLWSGNATKDGPLDFKAHYGLRASPYKDPYIARRSWRVMSLAAPSLRLAGNLTTFDLPFSVRPDKPLTLGQVKAMHRDHFEGTPYDTTQGLAAGPFGNPNRYDAYEGLTSAAQSKLAQKALAGAQPYAGSNTPGVPTEGFLRAQGTSAAPTGLFGEGPGADPLGIDRAMGLPPSFEDIQTAHFERTLSLFRTSYTVITELRPTPEGRALGGGAYGGKPSGNASSSSPSSSSSPAPAPARAPVPALPRDIAYRTWMAPHQAKTSVFMPLYATDPAQPAQALRQGSLYRFDQSSTWWVFCAVSNYAERAWRFIVRDIEAEQARIEGDIAEEVARAEEAALAVLIPHARGLLPGLAAAAAPAVPALSSTTSTSSSSSGAVISPEYVAARAKAQALLGSTGQALAARVHTDWWALFFHLLGRFHDGYRLDEPHNPEYTATPLFYPTWWLRAVRFWRHNADDRAAKAVERDASFWPASPEACSPPSSGVPGASSAAAAAAKSAQQAEAVASARGEVIPSVCKCPPGASGVAGDSALMGLGLGLGSAAAEQKRIAAEAEAAAAAAASEVEPAPAAAPAPAETRTKKQQKVPTGAASVQRPDDEAKSPSSPSSSSTSSSAHKAAAAAAGQHPQTPQQQATAGPLVPPSETSSWAQLLMVSVLTASIFMAGYFLGTRSAAQEALPHGYEPLPVSIN